jgi:hypothetical protein
MSGDTASAIFYLKTQAGWKEGGIKEVAEEKDTELTIVIKRASKDDS